MGSVRVNRELPPPLPLSKSHSHVLTKHLVVTGMERLGQEVERHFVQNLDPALLLSISRSLTAEMRQHLISSQQRMLPSFNYDLPSGQEQGLFLALEVGGSTLRMAIVELKGRIQGQNAMRIRQTMSSPIDKTVRQLENYAFFDWMAGNIRQLLLLDGETADMEKDSPALGMGVAWSFPIDQTSIQSGNVLGMGKGFHCSDVVQGHDLGDIIQSACRRARLNVRLDAIVNDSSSALLARAYLDPSTRIAVILGTGFNAAINIPVTSLHPSKFGSRAMAGQDRLTHVLTNTELSMFGRNILPTTRWDDDLNEKHIMPDYQPFEYLIAGDYIGELVRLIMAEAAETTDFFNGNLPASLTTPYSLDTRTVALIDIDRSTSMATARSILQSRHPSSHEPTLSDLLFIRTAIRAVIGRSVAYFAAGIHALTCLIEELETEAGMSLDIPSICIGCDGSIINKYPGYMETAQELLNELWKHDSKGRRPVVLEKTQESAVLGAGVAGAMAVG